MRTAAPKGGGATKLRITAEHCSSTTRAATGQAIPDLPAFRARLVAARWRLVERIAEDFPADRRFPDSGWSRLLADIQVAIMAVDAVVAEGGP